MKCQSLVLGKNEKKIKLSPADLCFTQHAKHKHDTHTFCDKYRKITGLKYLDTVSYWTLDILLISGCVFSGYTQI